MEIRSIPVAEINPALYNPRKDLQPGDPEYERLKRSLEEFGYVDPCVWNERTGNLVGGHQRLKILITGGATEVDCSVVDLDPDREKALNVALNKISGDWDMPKLQELLLDIEAAGLDVEITGFTKDEMDELLDRAEEGNQVREDGFDADAEAVKITNPVSQPGDLWILGRHRLLCGDATAGADVLKLMDGQLAEMIFTDPPYNVDYVGKTRDALRIQNDKMDGERFGEFLRAAFTHMQAATSPGGAIYVCHSDTEVVNFRTALTRAGWLLKQTVIWVKNAFVLGRQDYQWRHEPILYGWKPGAAHRWRGGRRQSTVIDESIPLVITREENGSHTLAFQVGIDQVVLRVPAYEILVLETDEASTIWRFDKPTRNADHPTMKPIGLAARAVRNSSQTGAIVLDSFLGGGATLMAAEQLDRRCFGLELDPRYCDVIVRRWEEFTGLKAVGVHDQQADS